MYDYRAKCLRIVGPLTLHLDIDLGFHVHTRTTVRLDALAQPEREGRAKVMAFVGEWLSAHPSFMVRSLYEREKYGRWLGIVVSDDGAVLNSELLRQGLVEQIDSAEIPAGEGDE